MGTFVVTATVRDAVLSLSPCEPLFVSRVMSVLLRSGCWGTC